MGRYSTVQVFSDNNPSMRSMSYDQATGSKNADGAATEVSPTTAAAAASSRPVRAEKVVNPYSSTAGAGSGEFHVYRHSRAREMARLKAIEDGDKNKQDELEFQQKMEAIRKDDEERTEKRKKKRQREKEAKQRKKALKDNGLLFVLNNNGIGDKGSGNEEEFEYTPLTNTDNCDSSSHVVSQNSIEKKVKLEESITNDGSFLEMMKKKMEEENLTSKG